MANGKKEKLILRR